mgnify:CR=1 FL=1
MQLAADLEKIGISIHALHAESDDEDAPSVYTEDQDFYPRSPCGERRILEFFPLLLFF